MNLMKIENRITLVVARYKENIDWLKSLPDTVSVVIFNKGSDIIAENNQTIFKLPNYGRESHTYFEYLLNHYTAGKQDFVVFSQGDPFEHSPDFKLLLQNSSQWREVQPLSWGYTSKNNIPPVKLLEADDSEYLDRGRIRSEHYSLHTWAPVSHIDEGANNIGNIYRKEQKLEAGVNIASHFLNRCLLNDLSLEASNAELGVFSYGAIFAVSDPLVSTLRNSRKSALEEMLKLSLGSKINGYMFERLWLHLFGEKFISLRKSIKF